MDAEENESSDRSRVSSGPLRVHREGNKVFVTGFGLWIEVRTEDEGRNLIRDLEDQGFRICY